MMLDEIDKVGAGIQGDPAAALLEVLDPEQNDTFRDTYLGVPFDLSRVVFIATANMLDTIPVPLRDRMEIIGLAGYTANEKFEIARRYLVRAADRGERPEGRSGVDRRRALARIIDRYTREAGVRRLEREIGRALRHAAVRIAEGSAGPIAIDAGRSRRDSRRRRSSRTKSPCAPACRASRQASPGRRSAATSSSSRRPRRPAHGGSILTGQLGEVMKESAQAALTIVKNRAAALGIDAERFEKTDIHIHVPAGATPKDGPSAGVAMFMALVR